MSDNPDSPATPESGSEIEAMRMVEECARSALASSKASLEVIDRAEGSLRSSEQRMAEVSAAAAVAAGEATEASMRVNEIATEFRILEEQVAEALNLDVRSAPREDRSHRPEPLSNGSNGFAPNGSVPAAASDFASAWESFDRRADRVIERLRGLEASTITVSRPGDEHGFATRS